MYETGTITPRGLAAALVRVVVLTVILMIAVGGTGAVLLAVSPTTIAIAFHSQFVDQGPSPALAPGTTTAYSMRFRNTGLAPWQRGTDKQVSLGVTGDSPKFADAGIADRWFTPNRIATTNEDIVLPGMIGTFTFNVRAPKAPGVYRIPVRPVIDGLAWLEDDGVILTVTSDLGFHSQLLGQSDHPILRPGETSQLTVSLRNTGGRTWVKGAPNQQVNIGVAGDDKSLSALGIGWPASNRVAVQAEPTVGPGGIGTFTFKVRAPATPGTYVLRLRPVADGVTWMEDDGLMSLITVVGGSSAAPKLEIPANAGAPRFTLSSSVSPATATQGAPVNVKASFTAAAAVTAVVGVEVYAPDGSTLVYQKWFDNESFAAGDAHEYTMTWPVPANATLGSYTLSLRAFSSGWKILYGSASASATFAVTPAASAVPQATSPGQPAPAATVPAARPSASTPPSSTTAPTVSPAPTAAPLPSFTTSASVSSTSVAVGQSLTVTASVQAASAGKALIDIEIYAATGSAPAYQVWFDNESFGAGQQHSYPATWQVPANAVLGTYSVKLGVYSPGWGTQYSWKDAAATFSVAAATPTPSPTPTAVPTASPSPTPVATPTVAPSPTVAPTASPSSPAPTPVPSPSFVRSASVSPTSVSAGQSVTITVRVTSATTMNALVDVAVIAPDGVTKANDQWFDNQAFTAGQQRTFTVNWLVPANVSGGTYTVGVGMFGPGWAPNYTWDNAAAILTIAGAAPTPIPTPAPTLPPPAGFSGLHIQGNQVLNASGQRVHIHGVNIGGTAYACAQGWGFFDGPSDNASIVAMKAWRVNAVRIPLNEICWLGINGVNPQYGGANYQNAIKNYVNLLTQNGMYAVLDLHFPGPGTLLANGQLPFPDMDHSPAFWASVANTFKGNTAVLFEPYNEPYSPDYSDAAGPWTCWRDGGTCAGVNYQVAGMQTLVNSIRSTGASNVIVLTGLRYGQLLTQWLAYKPNDPLNNLAAGFHVYNFNACIDVACFESNVAPVNSVVPVITTEAGNDTCDSAWENMLLNWFDSHGIGYLAWVWQTWGTTCAKISLISDYSGTPTQRGLNYRNHLSLLP